MKETKKKFNKTDKRQAYHIILSFKEGEVSPDTVFELTERFVKEYLGNDYEAVFAVHDNTEHPHRNGSLGLPHTAAPARSDRSRSGTADKIQPLLLSDCKIPWSCKMPAAVLP